MITIRNINPNLGEVSVSFCRETLQAAMDEMSQAVRDCGYECIEVSEGVDFEIVQLPEGMTMESVHYAQDGPREQVINRLLEIVSKCAGFGTLDATELAQEAQEVLDGMDV